MATRVSSKHGQTTRRGAKWQEHTPNSTRIRWQAPSRDWASCAERLARVLATLEEEQFLILTVTHGTRFVQFAAHGDEGMRAETKSNHYHEEATERLRPEQEAALVALGWRPPTGDHDAAGSGQDPHGSPNFFVDFAAPVRFEEVATLAVRTLIEVLGVPDPRRLAYTAFPWEGEAIELPDLELPRVASGDALDAARQARVRAILAVFETRSADPGFTYLGLDDVEIKGLRDGKLQFLSHTITDSSDWDEVGLRVVHTLVDSAYVRVYAQLVADVEPTPALVDYLHRMSTQQPLWRFVHQHGAVYALADLVAEPFVPAHLATALDALDETAYRMGPAIQKTFGGRVVPAPLPPDWDGDIV